MTQAAIEPLVEARQLAAELSADASERDLAGGTPKKQRARRWR